MIDDMRDALVAEVDVARADLERAVRRFDAIDTLATLATSVDDVEHAGELLTIERRLPLVERARWRNAMHDAAETELSPEIDVDTDDE